MKLLPLVLLFAAAACSSSSPTTPGTTTSTTTSTIPTSATAANVAQDGSLVAGLVDGTADAWQFSGVALNTGNACALNAGGEMQLVDRNAQPLGSPRTFTITGAISPQQRVPFTGCCFTRAELDVATSVRIAFTWTSTPSCPATATTVNAFPTTVRE